MPQRMICGVCKETEHKYRCPQCSILYCSVGCYSEHKDKTCDENVPNQDKHQDGNLETECDVTHERLKIPERLLEGMETEDMVTAEQLKLLGNSVELKAMLNNPHLRHMMTSLVTMDTPTTQLDVAMQEPIFTEFADKCLGIIHNRPDDDDDDFPEIEDL